MTYVPAIQARLTQLEETISRLQALNADHENRIQAGENEVASLRTELNALKAQEAVATEVASHRIELNDLKVLHEVTVSQLQVLNTDFEHYFETGESKCVELRAGLNAIKTQMRATIAKGLQGTPLLATYCYYYGDSEVEGCTRIAESLVNVQEWYQNRSVCSACKDRMCKERISRDPFPMWTDVCFYSEHSDIKDCTRFAQCGFYYASPRGNDYRFVCRPCFTRLRMQRPNPIKESSAIHPFIPPLNAFVDDKGFQKD